MADRDQVRAMSISAGTVLFRAGEECAGFLVLRRGAIKVSLTGAVGREIVLYRVAPGDICLQTFGCLVEGRRYSAEGVAETDLEVELIPPPEFQRLMAADPEFRSRLLASIARRFFDFEHMVESLAFTALAPRVARELLRLAGDGHEVVSTHERIATEIGSAREAVSRQLAALAREGWIRPGRGRLTLLDRPSLARLASAAQ